jgi:hypothetical protein
MIGAREGLDAALDSARLTAGRVREHPSGHSVVLTRRAIRAEPARDLKTPPEHPRRLANSGPLPSEDLGSCDQPGHSRRSAKVWFVA